MRHERQTNELRLSGAQKWAIREGYNEASCGEGTDAETALEEI